MNTINKQEPCLSQTEILRRWGLFVERKNLGVGQ
jgi:hypothetical protein